jgi:hypothetical protein
VQLTWDEDDPERNQVTRRTLTRQEIEDAEFRAYIASSGSESESDGDHSTTTKARENQCKGAKAASRDKLRALLLGNGGDDLPEGWGRDEGERKGDVDMEITFMPGLSKVKATEDETTLEKYQTKMKEKRKKRKEEVKEKGSMAPRAKRTDEEAEEHSPESLSRPLTTPEELNLLVASDNPNAEPKHFNLKSVLKAEKSKGMRTKGKGRKIGKDDDELQENFSIDVKDDRFKALHEDHTFAIDPSNPRSVRVSVVPLWVKLNCYDTIGSRKQRVWLPFWRNAPKGSRIDVTIWNLPAQSKEVGKRWREA